MALTSTSFTQEPPPLRLGFKASTVAVSLIVALVFLSVGSWLAGGELLSLFENGDFENGLFWLVFAFGGLYLLGVWVANAAARLVAGCALSAGSEGLRLYTLGSVVAWSDIEGIRYWWGAPKGGHFFTNLFKIASPDPHFYLTVIVRPQAFAKVAGRLNTIDLLVFMQSMRINRAHCKVFFACWPLDVQTQQLIASLERVAGAHGVALERDDRTTGFA